MSQIPFIDQLGDAIETAIERDAVRSSPGTGRAVPRPQMDAATGPIVLAVPWRSPAPPPRSPPSGSSTRRGW